MEDAASSHADQLESHLISAMEFDILDELLLGCDWPDAPTDYPSGFYLHGSPSVTALDASGYFSNHPGVEESTSGQDKVGRQSPTASQVVQPRQNDNYVTANALVPASPAPSVRDRLASALNYIKESYREGEVLIQIWVPTRSGGKQVLTTSDQPFSLDSASQRLESYRTVSMSYLFSADEGSNEGLGLPGRVFLGRLPEWTPDVRLFRSSEYPRVGYAQHFDVRGSIGIPVFEMGGKSCLGVVEVVMTTEKTNYSLEIANMCKALQAVDLRGGELPHVSHALKDNYDFYQCALPEIAEVLRTICETHNLPLGQAWMPCIYQGKKGSRHTGDNYKNCVSTIDDCCFVNDGSVRGFHEACSEHHLFKGQGVAGKAFTTNKPCFASDVTAFQKTEYPLSHHARVFNLRGAVAIRLRSVLAAKIDFVLEFFLPFDCVDHEEQTYILNSMSITVQQVSQNLRAVTTKEMQDDCMFPENDYTFVYNDEEETCIGVSHSQISGTNSNYNLINKKVSQSEKKSLQGYSYESQWDGGESLAIKDVSTNRSNYKKELDNLNESQDYNTVEPLANSGKERRNAKPEKMISLKVLQKYFAGSLKDAAKDLGVCPTTLKRICRQHGISRWPSRKIKKVGHSLKKLQKVIDSVQGVDKAFRFSSLCAGIENPFGIDLSFHNTSVITELSTMKKEESSDAQGCLVDIHTSVSNSPSSSCSQNSTQSHNCFDAEKLYSDASQLPIKIESSEFNENSNTVKSATYEVDLNLLSHESSVLPGSHILRSVGIFPSVHTWLGMDSQLKNLLGVKAYYGEDKVRFRFQPKWRLQDLKKEIATRFNITSPDVVELKYLDDDSEWVLLTCDADLQECIDVHQSSRTPIMKLFVNHTGQAGGS